ncbi:MAG: HIG1 domain-containing protein [Allosphingosinicella sp.]|uniref:HIG1 domain-containing protein n=1 Tax=Allosphingosinicella sp. TaxID=2823234 RepID=UPI00393A024A
MQIILILLLVGAALATLFVLIKGVIGLANNQTPERSQELMRKRILYQAIAILLAVLLLLTFGAR